MAQVQLVNMNDAVRDWAEVAIDRFHEALDEYNIGRLDGALWRSLAYELVQANGDIERVIIKFRQYGRFVDMGVGRGVPIGDRSSKGFEKARNEHGRLWRYGRKKKPWYSRTKTKEAGILRYILVKNYGKKTLADIENDFLKAELINPL